MSALPSSSGGSIVTLNELSPATRTSTDLGGLKHCDTSVIPVRSLDLPLGHDSHGEDFRTNHFCDRCRQRRLNKTWRCTEGCDWDICFDCHPDISIEPKDDNALTNKKEDEITKKISRQRICR